MCKSSVNIVFKDSTTTSCNISLTRISDLFLNNVFTGQLTGVPEGSVWFDPEDKKSSRGQLPQSFYENDKLWVQEQYRIAKLAAQKKINNTDSDSTELKESYSFEDLPPLLTPPMMPKARYRHPKGKNKLAILDVENISSYQRQPKTFYEYTPPNRPPDS